MVCANIATYNISHVEWGLKPHNKANALQTRKFLAIVSLNENSLIFDVSISLAFYL